MGLPRSGQAGEPDRQLRINHFKLAPCQLHLAGGQRNILPVPPLGLDHLPWFEGEQIAYPEITHRDRNVQLDRQAKCWGVQDDE